MERQRLNSINWISDYQRWLNQEESLNNAQMVVNHFKGTDWSNEAISALCGNMRHESSINPDMYEYGYAWGDDRGYGLVQWTPRSKYWNWAVANNLDPRSGDSQLARIDYEVENNIQWIPTSEFGGMTFKQFRTNSGSWSVDYLTEAFTWCYERPNRNAGEESMAARKAFARQCLVDLDFTGNGGGGITPPPSPIKGGTSSPAGEKKYEYEKEGTLNGMTYYQVKSGDSLSAIAKKYGVDMNGIKRVELKEISNKNAISKNEILLLPKATKTVSKPSPAKPKQTTVTYEIKKGEVLSVIAKRYKTTVNAIAKANNIKDPNKVQAGQKIKIPQ